jgi:hypothetical protein
VNTTPPKMDNRRIAEPFAMNGFNHLPVGYSGHERASPYAGSPSQSHPARALYFLEK